MSALQETKDWVESFVVRHGLCPFAAQPVKEKLVGYTLCPEQQTEKVVRHFLSSVLHLSERPSSEVETSLIVYPTAWTNFDDFLAFIDLCTELLEESGADAVIQLAHFHPDYCFADTDSDDVSNRTNRSPYPILQLLRVESVASAVAAFPEAANIWQTNVQKMKQLFQ